jgi:predicted RNase H-related nuclease YkuK (DUF458 family)
VNLDRVRSFISSTSMETRIFIGSDSERYKKRGKWMADYATAVVVHYDGSHGCKVFGDVITEVDYDSRRDRPTMRLMKETILAAQLYLDLAEAIGDRYFEVHLDINRDEVHASSTVLQQACGYVRGMCSVDPKIKPEAFASSSASDRILKRRKDFKDALATEEQTA